MADADPYSPHGLSPAEAAARLAADGPNELAPPQTPQRYLDFMRNTPGEILAEIEALVSQGVIEITLLGQNVNTYGVEFGDKGAFAK
ncbi:MAG TPA: cation-transporting P-type ATPase, partial [Piscinibacter sp.]|nr:cation-transporting P-type ATPase [Piscinibacter sp.]